MKVIKSTLRISQISKSFSVKILFNITSLYFCKSYFFTGKFLKSNQKLTEELNERQKHGKKQVQRPVIALFSYSLLDVDGKTHKEQDFRRRPRTGAIISL